MSYKITGYLAVLLAVARAAIIGPGAAAVAVAQQPAAAIIRTESLDARPRYSFGYSVTDGLTGDNKAQEETRNGDVVQGSYSLIEPDGSRRVVSYTADPINGFNAVVQRDPSIALKTAAAVAAAPAVRPVVAPASLIAEAAPAVVAVRPQAVLNVPFVRQPIVSGSTVAATNVVAANSGLLGLGVDVRSGSVYGTQAIVADSYGSGSVVKFH